MLKDLDLKDGLKIAAIALIGLYLYRKIQAGYPATLPQL